MGRECKWCGCVAAQPGSAYCSPTCEDAEFAHTETERERLKDPLERIADALERIEVQLRVLVRRGVS